MNIFIRLLILFLLYSFIGWIIETIYCSTKEKKFINRGFLNGPYCPMYGVAALAIVGMSELFINKFNISGDTYHLSLFFISVLISTSIEYCTGWFIDKVCKMKLWDYSDKPLNIHGYICLEFSIYWVVLAFVLLTLINPTFTKLIEKILLSDYKYLVLIILCAFFVDLSLTIKNIVKVNKIINKTNLLNIKNTIAKLKSQRRILINFEPNSFVTENSKKIAKLKEEIIKKILKK